MCKSALLLPKIKGGPENLGNARIFYIWFPLELQPGKELFEVCFRNEISRSSNARPRMLPNYPFMILFELGCKEKKVNNSIDYFGG